MDLNSIEKEILYLLSRGIRISDIGYFIFRSKRCVENRLYKMRLMTKCQTNYQLFYFVIKNMPKDSMDNIFENIDTKKHENKINEYLNDIDKIA